MFSGRGLKGLSDVCPALLCNMNIILAGNPNIVKKLYMLPEQIIDNLLADALLRIRLYFGYAQDNGPLRDPCSLL